MKKRKRQGAGRKFASTKVRIRPLTIARGTVTTASMWNAGAFLVSRLNNSIQYRENDPSILVWGVNDQKGNVCCVTKGIECNIKRDTRKDAGHS